ncbi:MAG: redoxin domain-containing protein [Planctomycetota bacterium]
MRWLATLVVVTLFTPLARSEFPVFRLRDVGGAVVSSESFQDAKAVVFVFLGTQCPVNNAYMPRLVELEERFAKDGVRLVGVNSNEHDSKETIREHAKAFKISFPILRDENQRLADVLGAQRTPEAIVVDPRGVVRYRGRIDDQYGVGFQRPHPTKNDLVDAVAGVLAGKETAIAKSNASGCLIARAPRVKIDSTLTYAKDVAKIVQNRCLECHRKGQIGPMPLLTYEDVSSWADMIKEVIVEKRMPPWHADPRFGSFHNDRSLTAAERDTFLRWIDGGCARGDDKDLPAVKTFSDGWTIGTPDVVFEMPRAYNVPAKAPARGVPYQYFVVPTKFTEDVWVRAAEVRPGNRAVVHHTLIYIIDGKRTGARVDGIGKGLLVSYAPGDIGSVYPAESAKRIPKGATLVFQMHYTPNGVAQTDRSQLGLVLAKEPPKHEVLSRAIAQQIIFLTPNRDNQKVQANSTFKEDVLIWALAPHMHLRGKAFQFEATYPDGKTETLLSVPRYDFGWQATYRLDRPLELPAGSSIKCTALYDNSPNNLNNPDPTRFVTWGDQTWEEMMIGFVDYSVKKK